MESLRVLAKQCIIENDIDQKIERSIDCYRSLISGNLMVDVKVEYESDIKPGRPKKPELVSPESVPRRGFGSSEGKAALLHAIAHIEFNAINLAWDAVFRFSNMPLEYYSDWAKVAYEETQHFLLLRNHLQSRSYDYGDFSAHNGLWQMAERTADDVMVRMALVPRVLEARGLDVTPDMIKRFESANENDAAEILKIIYQEEIGHVDIGSYWFHYLCEQRKIDSYETFKYLLNQYFTDGLRGPFNLDARGKAGFTQAEIDWLGNNQFKSKPNNKTNKVI